MNVAVWSLRFGQIGYTVRSELWSSISSCCSLLCCSNPEFRLVAPGCLAHADDAIASSLLHGLAMLKQKVCTTVLAFW